MSRPYPFTPILEVMKPCKVNTDSPTQARRLRQAMSSEYYIAEEKIDGCHYLSVGGRFFSTRLSVKDGLPVEKTYHVPHLWDILSQGKVHKVVLDGELCYPGQKSQDVVSIMGCYADEAVARQEQRGPLHYMVFDILRDQNGEWLQNYPWRIRRERLEAVMALLGYPIETGTLMMTKVVRGDKETFLQQVFDRGGEGIVLKDVEGKYIFGKRPMWNWIKVKREDEEDVVIVGFEPATKLYTGKDLDNWPFWSEEGLPLTRYYARGWIGAIIFGKYDPETKLLVPLGTCSGMEDLAREMFSREPNEFIGRVMKLKYMEVTRDGAYRHPQYVGLHPDKNPTECVLG